MNKTALTVIDVIIEHLDKEIDQQKIFLERAKKSVDFRVNEKTTLTWAHSVKASVESFEETYANLKILQAKKQTLVDLKKEILSIKF